MYIAHNVLTVTWSDGLQNIGTNKDGNIKELKDRLKLVESEIRAGNNNAVVKKEMKEIIQKLHLYKVISHNNGKAYLNQFWK